MLYPPGYPHVKCRVMQYAIMHARCCAGNQITGAGIGDVVQFARTQGCDATLVDLSKNLLDDDAALNELTRLVKNYGTFGSQNFLRELLLSWLPLCDLFRARRLSARFKGWAEAALEAHGSVAVLCNATRDYDSLDFAQRLDCRSLRWSLLGELPKSSAPDRRHQLADSCAQVGDQLFALRGSTLAVTTVPAPAAGSSNLSNARICILSRRYSPRCCCRWPADPALNTPCSHRHSPAPAAGLPPIHFLSGKLHQIEA